MSPNETELKPAKAQERLIEAARNLFHERGFERTSVEDILKASGVARSNFYYHFNGKEALAKAVLEAQMARFRDQVLAKTLKDPNLAVKERFERFLGVVLEAQERWGTHRGSFFGGFAFEFGARQSSLSQAVATFFRAVEYALADCLAEGALVGAFRFDVEPQLMARVILATLEGATLIAKAQNDIIVLKTALDGVQRLVRPR